MKDKLMTRVIVGWIIVVAVEIVFRLMVKDLL